jgi:predicted metal-binding membrane protein
MDRGGAAGRLRGGGRISKVATISFRRPDGFAILFAVLVVLAWFTLWIWEQSPYGRYLDHGQWTEIGLAASICRTLPAGEFLFPALLYVGGWLAMTAAMMLPTTLPLLQIFRRLSAGRSDRRLLLALVVAGYLTVWVGFGIAAHGLDLALHELVERSPWLIFNGWALGAAVLAIAALYQFSPLKYRCLDKCRTPLSFVMARWRGTAHRKHAFLLGIDHGLFCVGCCWALMLLMFVVGAGNVGWMLLLGAVMAAEKNLTWGRRLSIPLGVVLLVWSAAIVVENVSMTA